MSLKCPHCGYENEDAALCCNLCQNVLRKEKPAPPPAPPPPEPAKLDSLDALKALLVAARAAADRGDQGEIARLMGRLFLETDLDDLKAVLAAAGELWLQSTALDPVRAAASRAELAVAAQAAAQEDFAKALAFVKLVLDKAPAAPGQDLTLALLAVGLKSAAEDMADEARRDAQFKALVDRGLKAYTSPGGHAEGLALLEQARASLPDPPLTARDKARRERLSALMAGLRKADAPGEPAAPAHAPAWLRQAV
ncbi:MAG: hypothetical protein PHU21_14785, partial [Elusimicrobia bacterium]|nr:hypothetical protein [Elusimicrobiota bacterium]